MLRRTTAIAAVALAVLASCGSDDDTADPSSTTTTPEVESTTSTAPPEPLVILVTNDDGIGAPGIDALVNILAELEEVELVVVAPAENQSGTSDRTTPGGASYSAGATASGVEGTAVAGFPADTIAVALDELGLEPDVVVSGINEGQNTGPLAFISGTVGAARTAARRGIPAVAGSAGLGEGADYASAVAFVVEWIEEHRAELLSGGAATDTITSFNVLDCTAGDPKGDVLEVALASAFLEGVEPFTSDCTLEPATAPTDDVAALAAGFAAETQVPLEAPVASS
ncbi:MAG: 5'/3'-nucleotidase SurE [Acidimicrobiales bacterium]